MKTLGFAALLIGVLAASAAAQVNVAVTADATTVEIGQATTIHILAQGAGSGLAGLAGSVQATGTVGSLASTAGSFAWTPSFSAAPTPTWPMGAVLGAPDADGGWAGFGSMQTVYPPSADFAKVSLVEVASYTVVGTALGTVDLTFVPGEFGGFVPIETNQSEVIGQLQGVTIRVVPEPLTLALLVLGVPLLRRCRRGL